MSESEIEEARIEAANRVDSWREIETCLTRAKDAVEWAQGCLDDVREPGFAEQLQPLVDDLRRAASDARERASS